MGGTTPEERGATGRPVTNGQHLLYADRLVRLVLIDRPGPSMIQIIGELDRSNSAEVLRTLEQARDMDGDLIVDVGRVTFADLGGVRTLAVFADDGTACVRNVPHQMRRLLRLMGLPQFDGTET